MDEEVLDMKLMYLNAAIPSKFAFKPKQESS